MKIKSMFKVIQGHQITDKELYKNLGDIPVLTGKNTVKGKWNNKIIDEKDLPCITYPTKANSGEAYIQNEIFDANNTAILIPLPEWRDNINLEWLLSKLPSIFLKIQTSRSGVSYLNKEIVDEYNLEIPSEDIQQIELKYYKKLHFFMIKLYEIKHKIKRVKEKNLQFDNWTSITIILSEILEYRSRNDILTEEYLYKRSPELENSDSIITIISGSTENYYGAIPFEDKIHFVKDRPCLQVIRIGKSGNLKFLNKGNYATNANAMLLIIKESKKDELGINSLEDEETFLKFLEFYLHPYFTNYCSSADLSVLPVSKAIDEIRIPFIKYNDKIRGIVDKIRVLEEYERKVYDILSEIHTIMDKQLIS